MSAYVLTVYLGCNVVKQYSPVSLAGLPQELNILGETVGKGRKLLSDGVVLLKGGSRLFRNDTIYDGCFGFPTVWVHSNRLVTSSEGRKTYRC